MIVPVPVHCFSITFILPVTIKGVFTSTDHRGYTIWSCHNVYGTLSYMYLLYNIYIRFDTKLYRQNIIKIIIIKSLFIEDNILS